MGIALACHRDDRYILVTHLPLVPRINPTYNQYDKADVRHRDRPEMIIPKKTSFFFCVLVHTRDLFHVETHNAPAMQIEQQYCDGANIITKRILSNM